MLSSSRLAAESMELLIRPVGMGDCDDIYRWENDAETRRMSFSQASIPYAEHRKWFEEALRDTRRIFFLGEEDGQKVGVIRFDFFDENLPHANVTVAPAARGRGVATRLIRQGTALVCRSREVSGVIAEIRRENLASLRAFQKADYHVIGERGDVLITRYGCDRGAPGSDLSA